MVRVQCLCVCVCGVRSSVSEHLRLGGRFVATPHREACAVKGAGRVRPGNWSAGWYLRHSGDGVKYVVGLSETYLTTAIFPAPHTRTTRRARHDSVPYAATLRVLGRTRDGGVDLDGAMRRDTPAFVVRGRNDAQTTPAGRAGVADGYIAQSSYSHTWMCVMRPS